MGEAKRLCQRQYVDVNRYETDLCRAVLKLVSKYENDLHNNSVLAVTEDGLEHEKHTFERMETESGDIERRLEEFYDKLDDKDRKLSEIFTIVDSEVERKIQDLTAKELMQRWKLAKTRLLFRVSQVTCAAPLLEKLLGEINKHEEWLDVNSDFLNEDRFNNSEQQLASSETQKHIIEEIKDYLDAVCS